MTRTESIYPNDKVIVREVGLRDGLQLVKEWPDISAKKAWLDADHQAGARHFEIGSFLPAKGFPQFADIFDVIKHVGFLCQEMTRLNASAPLIIHLHDTRGLGIANAAAALDSGDRILDTSLVGLGGCPFAPGATGNIVFEDVIFLCERMGFATNIDIEALGKARLIAKQAIPSETFYGNLQRAGVPKNITWDGPITELQTTKKIIS